LYAKTAENGFSGNYNDLTNKPTIDGSETKVTAGTNITVTGTGTTGSPYVVNGKVHYIGESYGGGIVFYAYDNGQHGLIAATSDQSTAMRWFAGTNTPIRTIRDGVNAGQANTTIIIAAQGNGDGNTYAALLCSQYSIEVNGVTYGDWYLPSKLESELLYLQKQAVGGFANARYWSSTEHVTYNDCAWITDLGNGGQVWFNKNEPYHVRAIRAF
jgi:hypothetical protein